MNRSKKNTEPKKTPIKPKKISDKSSENLKDPETFKDWKLNNEILFLKLLLANKFVSMRDIEECLKELAVSSEHHSLVHILIKKRLLVMDDVTNIFEIQKGLSLTCHNCKRNFLYGEIAEKKSFGCPLCGETLKEVGYLDNISISSSLIDILKQSILNDPSLDIEYAKSSNPAASGFVEPPTPTPDKQIVTKKSKHTSRPEGETKVSSNEKNQTLIFTQKIQGQEFGNYCLLEEIARGGMGVVYKGRQKGIGRIVAIKMMREIDINNQEQVKRFHREIEAIGTLRHPNIIGIHEVGECGGIPFFTMDYINGPSLAELLENNPPSITEASRLIKIIANGVHYAHTKGILHRDLKPANILIDQEGRPVITDFGLAKNLNEWSNFTQSGSALGTPHYMAPEQTHGKSKELGPAVDIYALGTILYEIVTGRVPFDSDTAPELYYKLANEDPPLPSSINPQIPKALETVILKAMAKRPHDRYPTALAFAEDLDRLERGESILAKRQPLFLSILRKLKHYQTYIYLIVSVISVTALIITLLCYRKPSQKKSEFAGNDEVEVALNNLKTLAKMQNWKEVTEVSRHIISQYPDNPKTFYAYMKLGNALLNLNDLKGALSTFSALYCKSSDPASETEAMEGLINTLLNMGEPEYAENIFKTWNLREYRGISIKKDIEARFYMELGEFSKAQKIVNKLYNSDTMDVKLTQKWLNSLNPSERFPVSALGALLVDIDKDGQMEIAVWNKKEFTIYSRTSGGKWMEKIKAFPISKTYFTGPAIFIDANGDNTLDLLIAGEIESGASILHRFLNKDGNFVTLTPIEASEKIVNIWVGDLEEDGYNEFILVYDGYQHVPELHIHAEDTWKIYGLSNKWRDECAHILSIDTADFDNDKIQEIILGTSPPIRGYNLSVYSYQPYNNKCSLVCKKKVGIVTGCKAADINQDGKQEILVSVGDTPESINIGIPYDNPYGLQIIRYEDGQLQTIWEQRLNRASGKNILLRSLVSGQLGHGLGMVLAVLCDLPSNLVKDDVQHFVWLVGYHEGKYNNFRFSIPGKEPLQCLIGDVDADGEGELIIITNDEIIIYGVQNN